MINELKKLAILNPKRAEEGFIGSIYAFVNKSNQKIYIGKTIEYYKSRWTEHKCCAFTKNIVNHFYNAIRKYSWEGFDKYVIYQTEEMMDKNLCNEEIIKQEVFYINKFKTTNSSLGYNSTAGGEGVVGYTHTSETKQKLSESHSGDKHWKYGKLNSGGKAVLQFDLDFNFVKEWTSMKEIERELGYKSNNISRCCSNQCISYKNFIWVKKEEYFEGYLQKFKNRVRCKSNDKTVLQFDFLGNFIKEYISCSEAGKALGKSTVCTAANGRDPQLYGFIWIYKEDFSEDLLKEKLKNVKTCRFYNKIISELQHN